MSRLGRFLIVFSLFIGHVGAVSAQAGNSVIHLIDRRGAETSRLTDGNLVRLSLKLAGAAAADTRVAFVLDGLATPVAVCSIAAGANSCTSDEFAAMGWFWGPQGLAQPSRVMHVSLNGQPDLAVLELSIKPRPVVMVHGFLSSWKTWQAYLGPTGYLSSLGLDGFAVGDGQAPGVLNTGSSSDPAARTNSIAQNAEILKGYIAAIQQKTGAEKVDLLVHSMGGMISRYYLDRLMDQDNVAQVIFLGTPMAGSACVYPMAALGNLMPASLEILPDYMVNIFNRQIIHRHGIPFYMVAGTLLIDPLTSPCASAPSDTVVGLDSATALQMDGVQQLPMYHGNMTSDKTVFEDKVVHLLQNQPDTFAPRADFQASAVSAIKEQFSRAYTGHLQPGESQVVTINIDPDVSLANFSLYDSSRSLETEVTGASGKIITLDAVRNGLRKLDDPSSMLYLGYGFKQPKPGKWLVKLKTSAQTPASGADYAITARFVGGAKLTASSAPTIPTLGQPVSLQARLEVAGQEVLVDSAEALLRKPDGSQMTLKLLAQGQTYGAEYKPDLPGLHSLEIRLIGHVAGGGTIDRAVFLTFEVQPGSAQINTARLVTGVILVVLFVLGLLLLLLLVWVIRKRRQARRV